MPIEHPNRATAAARTTRLVVIVLLLTSAGLVLVVALAGWSALEGAKGVTLACAALDLGFAVLVGRWRRGVLPVAAAVAVVLALFAAVAGPAWFERDRPGYAETALDAGLLGILTLLLVPVGVLLAAFALRGFAQAWHVEVEVSSGGPGPASPRASAAGR
jgi:hypothetical protein